ncbi:MAG: hypothetical protein EOO38_01820 [Cytophagaceae bacterium]|nr:MAG: hypothetical protein EOO38_01820 [Cytophagaceae bacterium]
MAQTPDHRPGVSGFEDQESLYADNGTLYPSTAGGQAYGNGVFRFKDASGTYDPRTVYQLTHTAIADLAHAGTCGPAGVNAYKTVSYVAGTIVPAGVIWWTDSSKTARFWDLTYTWVAGDYRNPQKIVWQLYAPGTTVLHTITDTIVWSGPVEVSRTRVYT